MSQEPWGPWSWGWWPIPWEWPAAGQYQQQWTARAHGGKGQKGLGVYPGPDAEPAQGGKGAKGQAQAAQGGKGKKGLGVRPGPDAEPLVTHWLTRGVSHAAGDGNVSFACWLACRFGVSLGRDWFEVWHYVWFDCWFGVSLGWLLVVATSLKTM